MSAITDAFYVYRAQQREIDASQLIIDAVRDALEPFRPNVVQLYLTDEVFYGQLELTINNLPSYQIVLRVDKDLIIKDLRAAYFDLAQQAADAIRAVPRIDPPENFELGEN